MTGHRMSALPLAALCSKSALLGATYGAGLNALKGQAAHARFAGDTTKARRLLDRLPIQDRIEVESWKQPADISFVDRGETVVLLYRQAIKEHEVALNKHGFHCTVDDPQLLTLGHLDMAWVHVFADGTRWAYIGDIKKTSWTTVDGPNSLQVIAYGLAFASKHDCDGFTCGLWIAEEERWIWAPEGIACDSPEHMRALDRVLAAADNRSEEAVTGSHCWNCWGRLHCAEHLLPAALAEHAPFLKGLTEATPGNVDSSQALEALNWYRTTKDLTEAVYGGLKAFAARNGGIYDPTAKKRWVIGTQQGGERVVSAAKLREALGPEAEKYIVRGAPRKQAMWRKAER